MQRYKIVDKKAPRFRRSKFRYNLVNKDLWKRFIDETGIDVSWDEFRDINASIGLEITNMAIEERDGVILPEQMGNIWLGLFKMATRPLNEQHMRTTGEHATFFSFETFGLQGKICWDFDNCRYKVKNYPYWGFVGHRDFKTKASHNFKENPELYKRIKIEDESNTKRSNISSEDAK